jgi:hypothetical protein
VSLDEKEQKSVYFSTTILQASKKNLKLIIKRRASMIDLKSIKDEEYVATCGR